MPTLPFLYANDLVNTLKRSAEENRFKEMVVYIEACESGSVFDGLLPSNIKVYGTTAGNTHACFGMLQTVKTEEHVVYIAVGSICEMLHQPSVCGCFSATPSNDGPQFLKAPRLRVNDKHLLQEFPFRHSHTSRVHLTLPAATCEVSGRFLNKFTHEC